MEVHGARSLRDVEADLLDDLDEHQRLAVCAEPGLVAVIAAAGSGKTRVLARRIAHRVRLGTADARHVAAITFTRDAAWELRRRLRALRLHDEIVAGTFHATAYALLRQRWADLGRPAPSLAADRRQLVADVLGGHRRSSGPARAEVLDVAAEIDWARARLVTPERYEAEARAAARSPSPGLSRTAELYAAYEAHKRARKVIDLDDLLTQMTEAIERDPRYAEVVRWRLRHLHLDEAQDLNPLQHAVLEAWRGGRHDLFLVGDPAQAIYGWNGADPGFLLDVADRYPGVTVIRLDRNFRSSPQVLDVGRHLLAAGGLPPTIQATRPDGPAVELHAFPDEESEAAGVARLVRSARPPGGRYRAIAVLVRTNTQVAFLEDHLRRAGVPVRSRRSRMAVERALQEAGAQGGAAQLLAWAAEVAHTTGDDPDEVARRRVALAVDEFLSEVGTGDARTFADWARTTGAVPDLDPDDDDDGVEVTTFHAAKGREWATVVLAGFESRLVPHVSARGRDQQAEEVRLAYVAVTRAVHRLLITWSTHRHGRPTGPSRLLSGWTPRISDATPPPPEFAQAGPTVETAPARTAALAEWRRAAARAAAVPESVVCSDQQLRRLVALSDVETITLDDISAVIGSMAARRHGARLLEVLTSAASEPSGGRA